MSDDTPTKRFEQPDAPTEVISPSSGLPADGVPAAGLPPTDPPAGDAGQAAGDGRSRRNLIILLSIIGALLLAVLIALVLLLTGNAAPSPDASPMPTKSSSTPTPTASSPTPKPTVTVTKTATPTPEPTTPPPPPSPISAFTASKTTVDCSASSSVPVTFSWAAVGETLWFGVGTDNAKDFGDGEFPLNYTLDYDYQCGQSSAQQKYTITVQASNGTLKSNSIIIKEI